jgi:putative DNA primase/helicase
MATNNNGNASTPSGGSPPAGAGDADRNSVQQARPRERKSGSKRDAQPEGGGTARPARQVNSISAPRSRGASAGERFEAEEQRKGKQEAAQTTRSESKEPERAAPVSAEDHQTVPDHVRRRFVQVGRKYYFPDGARAFTDRGRRLTTPSENTEVIRSLVTIAQARGWNEIVVRGTDSFRREAWFAARLMGLDVRGYRPTDIEQARLVRTLASRQPGVDERSAEAQPPRGPAHGSRGERASRRSAGPELVTGRLIEHGRAPFQHDRHQPMSYFVKIETAQGERVIWGVDFERAFGESVTKPKAGDDIGLRAVRKDSVTVKTTKRDKTGKVIGEQDLDALRNRWIVEKRAFFDARTAAAEAVRNDRFPARDAVKAHPELVGTYLQIRAAELAAKKLKDPQDRVRFVSTVRRELADSVARGEPAPRVKLRERAANRPPTKARGARSAEQASARG